MITPHEPVPHNEVPRSHLFSMFVGAPSSFDGLPIYIGATLYVPIANMQYKSQRVTGVLALIVTGIGKDTVYFQHESFGRVNGVRSSDCYFDCDLAFKRFAHNQKLMGLSISPEQLLSAYMPPEPGQVSTVEVVA